MQLSRRFLILCLSTIVLLTFIFAYLPKISNQSSAKVFRIHRYAPDPSSDSDTPFSDAEYQRENSDSYNEDSRDSDNDDDDNDNQIMDHTNPAMMLPSSSLKQLRLNHKTLTGGVIAPKLENETAKAELGQAAWKLFHTTFARFPDKPSEDEQQALHAWVLLFARLYPCGECAKHFQTILEKFPPQVRTRSDAAAWGCHVHNEVNKSLQKNIFDCSKIGDFYDCGCGDNDDDEKTSNKANRDSRDQPFIPSDELEPVELAKEDFQRGG